MANLFPEDGKTRQNVYGEQDFKDNVYLKGTLLSAGVADGVTGAASLLTAGAIPLVSSSGVLTQDAANLFWDDTNNRLGVGTNAPADRVHIVSPAGLAAMRIQAGSVGYAAADLYNSSGTFIGGFGYGSTGSAFSNLVYLLSTTDVIIGSGTTGPIRVKSTGPVGVGPGNTSPVVTLSVYDATATTGVTTQTIRAGAGQAASLLLALYANNGSTLLAGISAAGNLIQTLTTPASASATGVAGTITADTDYVYVCTATDTWKRVAILTW